MTVKTGSAWAGTFVTLDATGALSAGSPSGVLYVDGTANGATVTITGSNPYKWSVTLPALTAGQRVDMYITATISTIATASVVASEQADTALISDVETDIAAVDSDVWGYSSRTLTQSAASVTAAVSGSSITAHRGDTLSAALENIGALTNYSKLWFTVKRDYDDADTAAVIQIEKTGGLLYLNGAVGTAGNGSLTINDEATGDVTIVLNASETAKLSPGNYQYDIQILRSAGTPVSTLTYGEFVVAADVTKATA